MVDVSNLVNDNLQSTKKLELLDLSVYWNYNYANEYILKPVKADVIITKDKNHAPLQVFFDPLSRVVLPAKKVFETIIFYGI